MKSAKLMILTALATVMTGSWLVVQPAKAAPKSGPFYTEQTALANAPQGTPMTDYFSVPTNNSHVQNNSAKVVSATSPIAGQTNDAVRITPNAAGQTGAIWSTKESFDLSKDQVASMWIFASGGLNKTPGDGMAFVLQNAGDTNQFSDNGEALGVWGVDPKSTTASPSALANSAIPKSWALEFDTYKNDFQPSTLLAVSAGSWDLDSYDPSSFDLGSSAFEGGSTSGSGKPISGPHIAANYPGDSGTYLAKGPSYGRRSGDSLIFPSKYYYYGMNHVGYIDASGKLADNEWHHITLNYRAPTTTGGNGAMTYSYNDKNPQTGLSQPATDTRTVPLDLSKFKLADGQTSIRWGFTGSTGESSESNLVIFDQIPGQTKTTAAASMSYEKAGQQVAVKAGDEVPGGSNVTLTYTGQRQSGDAAWTGVNAEIKVPDHLNLNGTAKIDYADGTSRQTSITKQSDGYAQVKLAQDGSEAGATLAGTEAVKITIGGKTQNPASGKTYDSGEDLTSYFKGDNAVSTAASPMFTVSHANIAALNLTPNQTTVHVNLGENPVITGKVESGDGTPLTNSTINVRVWVVNNSTGNTLFPTFTLSDDNPASGFKFEVPAVEKNLKAGKYTLNMEATDANNNLAKATVTVIIGDVAFGDTSGDLDFTSALSGSDQVVQRADNDWSFNINDTLTAGSQWKLYARASELTSKTMPGTTLDGQLIYRDQTGDQPLDPATNTLIVDHQSDGTTQPFNIATDWDRTSGVLLKLNGGAQEGQYQGDITWTLTDAP